MQTLFIKQKDGTTRKVTVIRSWQDASGKHIFLHHNGKYADNTGSPMKSAADFDILPQHQREQALKWWERTGKAQSEEYYALKATEEAARAGDFQERLAAEEANSRLDAVLYVRKSARGNAVTKPQSWMEFGFSSRPDWWAQANRIAFADCTYIIADADEPEPETQKVDKDAKK